MEEVTLDPVEGQEPATPETPAAVAPVVEPIDLEAVRAAAREEGFRLAQQAQTQVNAPTVTEPAPPQVDYDIEFTEPQKFREQQDAVTQFRIDQAVNKATSRLRAEYEPALRTLETQAVVAKITNGLEPEAAQYVENFAKKLNLSQATPEVAELLRHAGKGYAAEKNPPRVSPERSTAASSTALPFELQTLVDKKYMTLAEAQAEARG